MSPQFVTTLPFGYDEQTKMGLTPTNDKAVVGLQAKARVPFRSMMSA